MAFIRVNMDCITSGSKHGSMRHPNTIINTAPNIVLNPPIVENHLISKFSGFHPFPSLNWNISNLFYFICDLFYYLFLIVAFLV
jgi:hypothetical protein